MDIEAIIAKRLKEHRMAQAWSLDDLAQRSGVSRAMISRIERQDSSPTAGLLSRLCDALGITLSALMSDAAGAPASVNRRDQQLVWRDPETGYLRRLVSPAAAEGDTDIVAVDLPPGARVPYAPDTRTRYEQQVLVLQGELRLLIGKEVLNLHPGDCARMSLEHGHTFENPTATTTHYLVVVRKAAPSPTHR
ncbi:helix-turn-helix domain-containing protein [Ideonella sp. BN130291]|uniref:helix-turn-helix domain-containing protein n=1 Tax=Ideonella sp. BN130291 TaxID=3112940 RepID=UPI002E2534DB|nr:XRE family transcriptional regulator [Ideonella sp. BN130291]